MSLARGERLSSLRKNEAAVVFPCFDVILVIGPCGMSSLFGEVKVIPESTPKIIKKLSKYICVKIGAND